MIEHWKNLSLEDIPGEEWRDIIGYEGYYQVSSLGRIKRLARHRTKSHISKQGTVRGYMHICLCKNNIKETKRVHRLMAFAFIPNPDNKPYVNHKDGIRNNNILSNLEWCTNGENQLHSFRVLGRIPKLALLGKTGSLCKTSKKIYQYDLDGNFIKEWHGIYETTRILKCQGLSSAIIKQKICNGSKWSYSPNGISEKYKKYRGLSREILQYDLNDNLILEWDSPSTIQKKLKIPCGQINHCCNGRTKTCHGYKWKYKNNIL